MQTSLENPYDAMNPITEAQGFFGRDRELRRIYSVILKGESVSLVGPRRIGKTSILKCMGLPEILARCEHNLSSHILVYIDVRVHLQKSSKDFFEIVCK